MDIGELLTAERVVLDLRVRDKAGLLREVARQFERTVPSLRADAVEAALLAREGLGSTGLGGGFALPHARVEGLRGFLGMFVRLARPTAFEAIDGKPVVLVFVLLTPSESSVPHVAALAAITRRFRDAALATKLRGAKTPVEAFGFLTGT